MPSLATRLRGPARRSSSPERRLAGRRALVTGASSGIGLATARALAAEGCDVVLVARGVEALEASARSAAELGVRAHPVPADLGSREECERVVGEAVALLGGLDLLVLSLASCSFGHFEDVPPEDFDRVVDVTLGGVVNTTRAALPHLEAAKGAIVQVGSLVATTPLPTFAAYCTAKHAAHGFLTSLRAELRGARRGVAVCIVHPGAVASPLWERVTSSTGRLPRLPPIGIAPEVVAQAVVDSAVQRRAEKTVTFEAVALGALYRTSRAVGDLVFVAVDRFYLSGREQAPEPGSLWSPAGAGRVRGRMRIRPGWPRPRAPRVPERIAGPETGAGAPATPPPVSTNGVGAG